jgi:hypothetical protein
MDKLNNISEATMGLFNKFKEYGDEDFDSKVKELLKLEGIVNLNCNGEE